MFQEDGKPHRDPTIPYRNRTTNKGKRRRRASKAATLRRNANITNRERPLRFPFPLPNLHHPKRPRRPKKATKMHHRKKDPPIPRHHRHTHQNRYRGKRTKDHLLPYLFLLKSNWGQQEARTLTTKHHRSNRSKANRPNRLFRHVLIPPTILLYRCNTKSKVHMQSQRYKRNNKRRPNWVGGRPSHHWGQPSKRQRVPTHRPSPKLQFRPSYFHHPSGSKTK